MTFEHRVGKTNTKYNTYLKMYLHYMFFSELRKKQASITNISALEVGCSKFSPFSLQDDKKYCLNCTAEHRRYAQSICRVNKGRYY